MAKIITVPNPILRKKSKPIKDLDKKTLKIIHDVEETLSSGEGPRGIGLSAVQVAKPIRVFCTYLPPSGDPNDESQKPVIQTFINPEIIKTSKKKTLGERDVKDKGSNVNGERKHPILEGCLSIPGIWGPVWRSQWIKAKWQDINGKWLSKKLEDFPSRVFQHELDHLEGILFTDHSILEKLPLYEAKGEKLEEISL